jgi:hypothetical protein
MPRLFPSLWDRVVSTIVGAATLVLFGMVLRDCTKVKPRPVSPAARPVVRECWGLEQWTVDGDSTIILKFHKMPKEAK